MWGRYAPAVHINMLISLDTFKKYRYSDIMDGRIDIDSTDCDDSQYDSGLTKKMKLDRLKYLSLFTGRTNVTEHDWDKTQYSDGISG